MKMRRIPKPISPLPGMVKHPTVHGAWVVASNTHINHLHNKVASLEAEVAELKSLIKPPTKKDKT